MHILDLLSLSLSLIGIYGVVVVALRVLLPRNIVPLISELFDKTMALTQQAEAINVPNASYYQENLAAYAYVCLYQRPLDRSQRSRAIFTDAYREPSLSGDFPAALPMYWGSDLEAVWSQATN
jgi:hypothetical protein